MHLEADRFQLSPRGHRRVAAIRGRREIGAAIQKPMGTDAQDTRQGHDPVGSRITVGLFPFDDGFRSHAQPMREILFGPFQGFAGLPNSLDNARVQVVSGRSRLRAAQS